MTTQREEIWLTTKPEKHYHPANPFGGIKPLACTKISKVLGEKNCLREIEYTVRLWPSNNLQEWHYANLDDADPCEHISLNGVMVDEKDPNYGIQKNESCSQMLLQCGICGIAFSIWMISHSTHREPWWRRLLRKYNFWRYPSEAYEEMDQIEKKYREKYTKRWWQFWKKLPSN